MLLAIAPGSGEDREQKRGLGVILPGGVQGHFTTGSEEQNSARVEGGCRSGSAWCVCVRVRVSVCMCECECMCV